MDDRRPTLAVSICVLGPEGALLVERGREPFKGRFSLPGGRVEFGETLEAAARRELLEETGIAVASADFLRLHETMGETHHTVIAVHRASLPEEAAPIAADDAASLRFVPLDEIGRLEAQGRTTPGLAAVVLSAA
jgi:8-oxo-dGTP diphosphatase